MLTSVDPIPEPYRNEKGPFKMKGFFNEVNRLGFIYCYVNQFLVPVFLMLECELF